jgi:hypothetical protein
MHKLQLDDDLTQKLIIVDFHCTAQPSPDQEHGTTQKVKFQRGDPISND